MFALGHRHRLLNTHSKSYDVPNKLAAIPAIVWSTASGRRIWLQLGDSSIYVTTADTVAMLNVRYHPTQP